MFFIDLLFVIVFALLLTLIFVAGFRYSGPWGIWWAFLLIILLGVWAGGLWFAPTLYQPTWLGLAGIPALFTGLFIALLLAAATPAARPPRTRKEAIVAQQEAEEVTFTAINIFFWILVVGLIVMIFIAYL